MIDFPATPIVGQIFTSGGQSWTWDGMKWVAYGVAQGIYLPLTGGKLTGALNPAGGIIGVIDGSDAAPGMVGEVISSVVLGPGVTLVSASGTNITSISLTAGDWDVQGEVWVAPGTGATLMQGAINTASAGMPVGPTMGVARTTISATFGTTGTFLPLSPCRASLAAATTYYLNANVTFSSGTTTAYGKIWARRVR